LKSKSKCRIILADDHNMFRAGLRKLIEEVAGYKIVAEAENGQELLEKVKKHSCDLVITDLAMPKLNGIEATKIIKKQHPHIKIMALTMHTEKEFYRKVLSHGVDAYILKDDVFEKLISAIKRVQQGEKAYSNKIMENVVNDFNTIQEGEKSMEVLTKREKEILKFIAEENTNKEISEIINISIRTVEAHRANLMDKLSIKSVQGLVKYAISKGLI